MNVVIGFGALALFFAVMIGSLYMVGGKDKDFNDYAVGGRSFGSWYQTMSFLNTWYPGTVFIAWAGMAATAGAIGFYALTYSLLIVVVMYLISRRVWLWGANFNLQTQSDLIGMRFNSRAVRIIAAVIGIVTQFPFIVLGMQALGMVFYYASYGHLSFRQAVVLGIAVLVIRQYWTVKMGMRGVVITDFVQGLVAYVIGSILLLGLIIWLVRHGHGFGDVPPTLWTLPGLGSATGPLYLFSLVFTGAIGGFAWPGMFARLFTANGVRTLKNSAGLGVPLSFIFFSLLVIFAILASTLTGVSKNPDHVFFMTTDMFGPWLVALAGVVVFAANVGSVDGLLQANGAQLAKDVVGDFVDLSDRGKVITAKIGIVAITVAAGAVASLNLTGLITLAIVSYQGIVQLAVPLFLGIFWRRGNKFGAVAGMLVGVGTAAVLQVLYPVSVLWLGGLTSGVAGMAVNLVIYVACAYLIPVSGAEKERVNHMFTTTPAASGGVPVTAGQG